MTTYCYPYRRGVGWRSQGFRSHPESPYNPPGGHTGFDQAMDAGTPIYAPGDGIIRNSGWLTDNYMANPWWLTAMGGDTLVIDCFGPDGRTETGPTFIIAHLQDSTAPVGARVKKGEQIGISGNSGTATTGAHAHIEALPPGWDWNNGVYGRVDPELYFTEYVDDLIQEEMTVAEADRVIAHINKVVYGGAPTAVQVKAPLWKVVVENQKRIGAIPLKVWATTVFRGGKKISALQELANTNTRLIAADAQVKILQSQLDVATRELEALKAQNEVTQ